MYTILSHHILVSIQKSRICITMSNAFKLAATQAVIIFVLRLV